MVELPETLKKILGKLGVNTNRLQWKLHYMKEGWAQKKRPLAGRFHWLTARNKFCLKCGTMLSEDEKYCPECGRRIPSRILYLLGRVTGLLNFGAAGTVTYSFVIVFMIFFLMMFVSGGYKAILSPTGISLVRMGALNIRDFEQGQIWRIFTMALLHIGIIHLLFNTIALVQIGPMLEEEIGQARMLVLITFTQAIAGVSSFIYYKSQFQGMPEGFLGPVTAGASGFLFGLIGFGIGYWLRRSDYNSRMIRNVMLQWGGYALVFGFVVGANNAAHIGGLLSGVLFGVLLNILPSPAHFPRMNVFWRALGVISAGLWIWSILALLLTRR